MIISFTCSKSLYNRYTNIVLSRSKSPITSSALSIFFVRLYLKSIFIAPRLAFNIAILLPILLFLGRKERVINLLSQLCSFHDWSKYSGVYLPSIDLLLSRSIYSFFSSYFRLIQSTFDCSIVLQGSGNIDSKIFDICKFNIPTKIYAPAVLSAPVTQHLLSNSCQYITLYDNPSFLLDPESSIVLIFHGYDKTSHLFPYQFLHFLFCSLNIIFFNFHRSRTIIVCLHPRIAFVLVPLNLISKILLRKSIFCLNSSCPPSASLVISYSPTVSSQLSIHYPHHSLVLHRDGCEFSFNSILGIIS